MAAGFACRSAVFRTLPLVHLREFGIQQPARPLLCRRTPAAGTLAAAAAPKYAGLPPEQQQQVDAFVDILLDWNQRMNLTAIKDRGECYERHVNDSLALLPALDRCLAAQQQSQQRHPPTHPQPPPPPPPPPPQQPQQPASQEQQWERGGSLPSSSSQRPGTPQPQEAAAGVAAGPRLIDVGSGAGLPGIILAIARPDWEVTLLDSLQKRCRFAEAAVEAAGLANVRVHWGRAEEAGQDPALRQQHDVAIARAVAELRVLAELCLPLVRPGGHWVAAKGAAPQDEVAAAAGAIGKMGGKLLGVEEVDSESPEGRRTAIVVLKARQTPAQYPRKPGVPGRKPL